MIFLQSLPYQVLTPYIAQYIYASFNSSELPTLKQTFLPYDIPAIAFFFGPVSLEHSRIHQAPPITASTPACAASYFVGLITSPFSFYFQENQEVKAFMIAFKPSGFSAFFRRDMTELTGHVPDFSLLAGASDADRFLEQLGEATDFNSRIKVADTFFLKKIMSYHYNHVQVAEACKKLIISDGLINIKELAHQTNMSLRTLERQFTEKVGVTPKLFARFKRFHSALSLINRQPPKPWSDIAYNCGYYDQAHFIKEFKTFTNQSPSEYFPPEYVLYNQMILYKNFIAF